MAQEQIFFHEGLTFDTLSTLQKPGFLARAENILFEREGIQDLRPFFRPINSVPVGANHSMKAWRGKVIIGDGYNLRGNYGKDNFTQLMTSAVSDPWQFKTYKDFVSASNGTEFVLIDTSLNVYPARAEAPFTAPSGSDGAAGNPNGIYRLYVTFYYVWPNGHTYETGFSPMGSDVTVTSTAIIWAGIPTSTYQPLYGSAPTVYRNLYRGPGVGGTLTEIFFVGTLADNTTTTYTDDISDADLGTSYVDAVAGYEPPVIPKYHEWDYGRLFAITSAFPNRLYYSEVAQGNTSIANEELMPIAMLDTNWDDIRVPGFDYVDPQGLISWGSYLYIPLKQTWIRKQGNDPATWAYRKTYATHGIGAPWTVDTAAQGIIGVTNPEFSEPGIAVFNGMQSEMVASPKLDYLFKTDLNIDAVANCRGKIAGKYYFLLYPSTGHTEPDRMLALDMRRYPDVRVANWTDLNGQCLDSDSQSKAFYIGGSDGYVRAKTGTGTLNVVVETHDLMGGDPKTVHLMKTWKEMKYALDSDGADVTLEVYIDDVLMKWPDDTTSKILTGTGKTTQVLRSLPPNWKGYRLRLVLTGTAMTTFELYSPWALDFEATV